MLLLCNDNLNEVLNLSCMRNGKLIGPTHCDVRRVPTVCNTGMSVRLTEMESNTIGLIIYRY